jgi:hypothetical protein
LPYQVPHLVGISQSSVSFSATFLRGHAVLSELLRKGEAHAAGYKITPSALLTARLFPDMFPLTGQVRAACDTAKRATARLVGVEPPRFEDNEATFEAPEIERAVTSFARSSSGGLIVTPSPLANRHRDLIIMLAARHRLPAVYAWRYYVTDGGLISYGPDSIDQYRRAAGYVDRILKGEKPADLPVQAPTKYELVINLKTARALGLDVPATLLARADEVIE